MAKHLEKQVDQQAAPEYIRRAAKRKLDKLDALRDLVARLQKRVKLLCSQEITPANENSIRATVGQFQLAIMNLAKLEGELGPEVQVNVQVQVKEQLVAMLNLLPADLRAQAYVILKEKATL
jgi:hypothetical protein